MASADRLYHIGFLTISKTPIDGAHGYVQFVTDTYRILSGELTGSRDKTSSGLVAIAAAGSASSLLTRRMK